MDTDDIENVYTSLEEEDVCQICYESNDKYTKLVTLPCNHQLCDVCLKKLHKKECPWCRSPINNNNTDQTDDLIEEVCCKHFMAILRIILLVCAIIYIIQIFNKN